MRRREFIGLLGSAAGAWICTDVFAAQKSPIARIGFLRVSAPPMSPPFAPECYTTPECKSFRRDAYQNSGCWLPYDLSALGWREGENLLIESRWGYGDPAKLPALAAELVALRPDLLVAGATIETKAFQAAHRSRRFPNVGQGDEGWRCHRINLKTAKALGITVVLTNSTGCQDI